MRNKTKGSGLFYRKNGPVKKYQQGGLSMGYGYKDPNKDMYRNIGDSAIFKNGVTGYDAGAFASAQPVKGSTFNKQVASPPNSSFSGNLLYKPTKGVQATGVTAVPAKGMNVGQPSHMPAGTMKAPKGNTGVDPNQVDLSGAASIGGAVNAVAQPALGLLDDKDPYTYTAKEKVGTAASSTIGTAAAGLSAGTALAAAGVGAAAGSAVPVIGTVIGAVVGLGIGLWKMSKKKKEAKKNRTNRNNALTQKLQANEKKRLAARDANTVSSAKSMYTQRPIGTPGGYLNN